MAAVPLKDAPFRKLPRGVREVLFERKRWGCHAGMEEHGLFKFPLCVTDVSPGTEAALAGLRRGDRLVAWHPGPGAWNSADAREVSGVQGWSEDGRELCSVDSETQQLLLAGGPCRFRVRLVPRCTDESCFGNIILVDDVHDHAMVCDECGLVMCSSLVSKEAEWRSFQEVEGCRVGREASSRFAQEGVGESALQATVMRGAGGATNASLLQASRSVGVGSEHAAARLELRLAVQQREAEGDISRLCDALDLNEMVKADAANLFAETAKTKGRRLANGGVFNTYIATLLASIHCASLVAQKRFACGARSLCEVLAVADLGAGADLPAVAQAVTKVRQANHKKNKYWIPLLQAEALVPRMCSRMALSYTFEMQCQTALRSIEQLDTGLGKPETAAAVAILFQLSPLPAPEDAAWLRKASEASGIGDKTLKAILDRVRTKWQQSKLGAV